MVLLSSDGFLAQLPLLFAETQKSGSVFVTVKRGACRRRYRAGSGTRVHVLVPRHLQSQPVTPVGPTPV